MRASADPDSIADALLAFAGDSPARRAAPLDVSARFGLVVRLALGKQVALGRADLRVAAGNGLLRRAALLFIARTQFVADADYYTLLGVSPHASTEAIRERHGLLMQIVHPDRAPGDIRWPEGVAARINRAYGTLKHPDARAAYDRQRRGDAAELAPGPPRPTSTAMMRRPPPPDLRSPLPEWLTSGVGGFVRRNPATVIFAVLISACSVAIATVAFVDQGSRLHRDRVREAPGAALPAAPSAAPILQPDLAAQPRIPAAPQPAVRTEPVARTQADAGRP